MTISGLGGIYIWHLIVHMTSLGFWGGGNLSLVMGSLSTGLYLAADIIATISPWWWWDKSIYWLRLTIFILECISVSFFLTLVIDVLIDEIAVHSISDDIQEVMLSEFIMTTVPTTILAGMGMFFEFYARDIDGKNSYWYGSEHDKALIDDYEREQRREALEQYYSFVNDEGILVRWWKNGESFKVALNSNATHYLDEMGDEYRSEYPFGYPFETIPLKNQTRRDIVQVREKMKEDYILRTNFFYTDDKGSERQVSKDSKHFPLNDDGTHYIDWTG